MPNQKTMRAVLFDAAASLDPATGDWLIPLHAWVYTPQAAKARRALIAELFQQRYGLAVTDANRAIFDRRISLLLSDNQPGIALSASIYRDGETGELVRKKLPPSRPNGHVATTIRLPKGMVPAGTMTLTARLDAPSNLAARITLVPQEGLSVICDIDDTVKVSGVTERRSLWEKTFFAPFTAVEGMPTLMQRLAGPAGAIHYVSSSPWHLYEPLREWMRSSDLPLAELDLKQIRLKDRSILNILKSPTETKPPAIRALLERFPARRFALVGDSGEKDPEIYSDMARQTLANNRNRIAGILIRLTPGGDNRPERFAVLSQTLPPGLLQTFASPAEVDLDRVMRSA